MTSSGNPNNQNAESLSVARNAGELKRYKLSLAYDGYLFHGWQKQNPKGEEPLRTVQGTVENELKRLLQQPITLIGASRTDAGVHAEGQVATFKAATPIPMDRMRDAINGRLPDDVEVRQIEVADMNFEPIGGAKRKRYRYRVHNTTRKPLFNRWYVHHCWYPLDIDRMNDAAKRLIGTHDCEGFASAAHGRMTTVRTIFSCGVVRATDSPEVHIVVEGDGFLYNMVRILAGTLIDVGRGHLEPTVIDEIHLTGQRSLAGTTLPPEGLCLEQIWY